MEKGFEIKCLDLGSVSYYDHLGSDSDIPRIARVSTGSENKGDEQDKKLLGYLYRNMHSSPFEFCNITYKLKCPLFVRDQIVRHRTMKFNIHSFRYSEPDEEFYVPAKWRKQDIKNRQASTPDSNFDFVEFNDVKLTQNDALEQHNQKSYELYKSLIKSGVAREMARMVLGTNIYTAMYINVDLNNLMKFFRLRLHEHAQFEVREYAKAMFTIFEQLYPMCAEVYKKYKMEIKEVID